MGALIVTALVAVAANAVLLPLLAYACIKLGLLPGVEWPSLGRQPATQSLSTGSGPQSVSQNGLIHVKVSDGGHPISFLLGQEYTAANTQAEATYAIAS